MMKMISTEKIFCNALLELMEEKPFYQIKASDLVKYVGSSRSTFYNYFDSIYEVLQKIEDDIFHDLEKEVLNKIRNMGKKKSVEQEKEIHEAAERHTRKYAREYRILMGENGDAAFDARLRRCMRKNSEAVMDSADKNMNSAQKRLYYEYLVGGKYCLLRFYIANIEKFNQEDMNELNTIISRSTQQALAREAI